MLNTQIHARPFRFSVTAAVEKTLRRFPPIRRHLRKRALSRALTQRCEIMQALGAVTLPSRLCEPAFLSLQGTRQRVLIRRPHARTKNYGFSLDYHLRAADQAYSLVCLDEMTGLAYVLWVPAQLGLSYMTYTAAQVRQQALLVLPYRR